MALSTAGGREQSAPGNPGAGVPAAVVSTKILPDTLIRLAADAGIQINQIPFIRTRPRNENALKASLAPLANRVIHVAFTSGIAAKAVAALLPTKPTWKLFSIHGETQKAVEACFPGSQLLATAAYGTELAAEIQKFPGVKELYFFCGNRRMNSIPDLLPAAGIPVREYVVYETELTPVSVPDPIQAVLFFSPSGVESFCSLNHIPKQVPLFSIGSTTTKAIQQRMDNPVYTAPKATAPAVIEQLIQTIKQQ
ncbi:hypothetical protein GCM10027051_02620 [Niabella terrae]